ncbi:Sulfur oxidation protein SoxZ [Rubrivivax sp. A210]|uniref:thiosulfate oxidation carrier complex protein SoxZ n=1 Tax=Rubrivivax sp. A210 TaxID=2772301 RepID=UPI00191B6741|nr:thiosulfate oxidation carrier complex protein SoxZ [Rubrivivax sp. A210]CAD5374516.1 Sulfur oxidation protein SoxZ [Rubrivivax sp. A210]
MATVRTLIHLPSPALRGAVIAIRASMAHPMETGHRPDAEGRLLPRDIVTRFECRLDGTLVFAADLYPAIAANPYLAFTLRAERDGELQFSWQGDHGLVHRETRRLVLG